MLQHTEYMLYNIVILYPRAILAFEEVGFPHPRGVAPWRDALKPLVEGRRFGPLSPHGLGGHGDWTSSGGTALPGLSAGTPGDHLGR